MKTCDGYAQAAAERQGFGELLSTSIERLSYRPYLGVATYLYETGTVHVSFDGWGDDPDPVGWKTVHRNAPC